MSTYEKLRDEYAFYNLIPRKPELVRWIRNEIRETSKNLVDVLKKPLTDEWRYRNDESGEYGIEYAIIQYEGQTREEIEDWLEENVAYPPICEPYDCTGKRFTCHIHWSITPAGVVVIHHWGLDV